MVTLFPSSDCPPTEVSVGRLTELSLIFRKLRMEESANNVALENKVSLIKMHNDKIDRFLNNTNIYIGDLLYD